MSQIRRRRLWIVTLVGVTLIVVMLGIGQRLLEKSSDGHQSVYKGLVPEESWPSWAPDSRRLVYECYRDGPVQTESLMQNLNLPDSDPDKWFLPEAADLCVGSVDTDSEVRIVSDQGGDWRPSWSPDGSSIAYLREDGIYLTTPEGGSSHQLLKVTFHTLCLLWPNNSVAWSPTDDYLAFSANYDHDDLDVYVLETATGVLTNLTSNSREHDFSPMWKPDGDQIAYLRAEAATRYGCDTEVTPVPEFRAVNIDGSGDRVLYEPQFPYPYWHISMTKEGAVLFVANIHAMSSEDDEWSRVWSLYSLDTSRGEVTRVMGTSKITGYRISMPVLSPNGHYLLYKEADDGSLGMLNTRTEQATRLSGSYLDLGKEFWYPVWSADGQKLAITSRKRVEYRNVTLEEVYIFDLHDQVLRPLPAQDH
jgi:Tol biopolymer transport system component